MKLIVAVSFCFLFLTNSNVLAQTCSAEAFKGFKVGDEIYINLKMTSFSELKKHMYCSEIDLGEMKISQILTEGKNKGTILVTPKERTRYCDEDHNKVPVGTMEIDCTKLKLIYKKSNCPGFDKPMIEKGHPNNKLHVTAFYGGCHYDESIVLARDDLGNPYKLEKKDLSPYVKGSHPRSLGENDLPNLSHGPRATSPQNSRAN